MGREASVFSTESLGEETIEDGNGILARPRRKTRIPGTLRITRAESVRRGGIDSEGSAVIGYLVEVRDKLSAKVTGG